MGCLELEGTGGREYTWLNRTAAGIAGGFGPGDKVSLLSISVGLTSALRRVDLSYSFRCFL
ncbi:unnamed protein product [Meloidogyne enterolobii]|uniref:Uncharacterized protein n=1 Tax=Meloidogyne enterolobii TaxID=390850 RepID=A0ACB1A1I7_MELEN